MQGSLKTSEAKTGFGKDFQAEIFAMDCFYMSFLISNKIPAYAGMTAFLCFQAAVRVLQRFQAAFLLWV